MAKKKKGSAQADDAANGSAKANGDGSGRTGSPSSAEPSTSALIICRNK